MRRWLPFVALSVIVYLGCSLGAVLGGTGRIAGVEFVEAVDAGPARLVLKGVGLCKRLVWKAYAGALYMEAGTDPRRVLEDVPKRLELEYFRHIPASAMATGTERGVAANAAAETVARFRRDLDRLKALYRDVRRGDRYALNYVPGKGMWLELNGERQGSFADPDLARAVFAVWLGERPLDAAFKRGVLNTP
jgi:hypothetical protein